jgi:hypothetical protein
MSLRVAVILVLIGVALGLALVIFIATPEGREEEVSPWRRLTIHN